MVRIGVVGDTHRDTDLATRALGLLGDLDLILHTGDHYTDARRISRELKAEVLAVVGNCDFNCSGPRERLIEVEGKKIYLTHGHLYGVKSGLLNLFYRGKEVEADLVVFGHTHRAVQEEKEGIILFNPGSPSLPREKRPTMGLVTFEQGAINTFIIDINSVLTGVDKSGLP